jgi:hypothetical protein
LTLADPHLLGCDTVLQTDELLIPFVSRRRQFCFETIFSFCTLFELLFHLQFCSGQFIPNCPDLNLQTFHSAGLTKATQIYECSAPHLLVCDTLLQELQFFPQVVVPVLTCLCLLRFLSQLSLNEPKETNKFVTERLAECSD